MSKTELFKTYYRAVKPDGTVWCQSSSAADVVLMSRGTPDLKFERQEIVTVTGDWEPWASPDSPTDLRLSDK